jgi:membrane-associated phospholipid phosphatase
MYDIISLSVCPLTISPLAIYIITYDIKYIYIFLWSIGLLVSTEFIKHITVYMSSNEIYKRPKGAYNCSAINNGGLVEYEPGFPSSHMALSTFVALSLCSNTHVSLQTTSIVYLLCMAESRMKKRCHNIFQVVGGACIGLLTHLIMNPCKISKAPLGDIV